VLLLLPFEFGKLSLAKRLPNAKQGAQVAKGENGARNVWKRDKSGAEQTPKIAKSEHA